MVRFSCPYLGGDVECSENRENHIGQRHPELVSQLRQLLSGTLESPDQVRRSARMNSALLLSRWYTDLHGGKHMVVAAMNEAAPVRRSWILTAYAARKLNEEGVEWKKS